MMPFAELTRRRFLHAGGLGLFGLTLDQFLYAKDRSKQAGAQSCIFIVVSGGLSHIDTLDPKPDAPEEIRGPYKPIATSVPGIQICDRMPLLAKQAHRYSIVRCLSHKDAVHVTAAHTMLTGQHDGRRSNNSPFMGSLIAKFRPTEANVPSYVWLHNMKTGTNKVPRYESGLNLIGYENAPLRIGYELDNPSAAEFRVRAFDPPQGTSRGQLVNRFNLLQRIEGVDNHLPGNLEGAKFQRYQERAMDLVTGTAARKAFDLNSEPDLMRDRYGRHPLGQYLLMARRLIEAGVRLVNVAAWPGLAPGMTKPTITQVWDMHDTRYKKGDSMYGNGPFGMQWSLPRLDQAVSALIDDMHERGLLKDTLVVLLSEFGRTPRFEGKGNGRGHWPHCYAGLLAGANTAAGAVYGASDKRGAQVAAGRPISHIDFGATLFHALGIPNETRFGPDDFSLRVNEGQHVRELFQ